MLIKKDRNNNNSNNNINVKRQSVKDVDITGKRIVMRVDYNVPMTPGTTTISDDTRIRASLPTIQYCLRRGATRIVLMSHLGRPDGAVNMSMSLRPCAQRLQELLAGVPVVFVEDCVGPTVQRQLKDTGVYLLENLRFHKQEEEGDGDFGQVLSSYGDIYVNDAFGTVHRPHASISRITIPVRVGGLLLCGELEAFGKLLADEGKHGMDLAILGGAKVSDKIVLIDRLMERVKTIIVGGAMAFTFIKVLGVGAIGDSLFDQKGAQYVEDLMKKATLLNVSIILPVDFRCSSQLDSDTMKVCSVSDGIPAGMSGFDIGPKTEALFKSVISNDCKAVLWNGPMGVFEKRQFANGTIAVIDALHDITTNHGAMTVVGGGDTAAAVHTLRPLAQVSHVSTGGGASLELMEGKALPGIEVLLPLE